MSARHPDKLRQTALFQTEIFQQPPVACISDLTVQTGGLQLMETLLSMSALHQPRQGRESAEVCQGEFPAVATGYGSKRYQEEGPRVHEASRFISC